METTTNNTTLRQRYDAWEKKTDGWFMSSEGWIKLISDEDGVRTYKSIPATEQDSAYSEIKSIFSEIAPDDAFDISMSWYLHGWALDLPDDKWATERWETLVSKMGD